MRAFLLMIVVTCFAVTIAAKNGTDPLKKQMTALRISKPIKIDANLDEAAWLQAPVAKDFVQNEPNPGAAPSQHSEVRILYNDNAIYLGAKLYDSHPDSIFQQLSDRDNFGNTDWFGVMIDAYQDGTNGVGFFVSPAGIQLDIKYFPNGDGGGSIIRSGDRNWDAVWRSETKITEEGWIVEIEIPYAAIRFPDKVEQIWNINFARLLRRNREQTFWSHVDPAQNGFLQQAGQISGISNIKSPLRLSATPFLAAYGDLYHDSNGAPKNIWGRSITGGMDLKYGLNDAFTLDMTLVPDFGQVQFDNQVLNLSPFEVFFDENRQFFTEGTELFNKGGLFYSRRVGGRPINFDLIEDNLSDKEEILENPTESPLVNASKISGRTNGGLGIGVFNAVSRRVYASIENTETGDKRQELTNPLTNYNVVVFDQNLKNNSFVTLTNTNVWREGSFYEANVTGLRFNLKDKAQAYELSGRGNISQQYFEQEDDIFGHTIRLNFRKISGNIQYAVNYVEESDDYDINDLGFLFSPNERTISGNISYNHFKPFSVFRRARVNLWTNYERLYLPSKFSSYGVFLDVFLLSNDNYGIGGNVYFEPIAAHDYFEPRTADFSRFYRQPTFWKVESFISSNYNKQFFFDASFEYFKFNAPGRNNLFVRFEPNVRVNDKLTFGMGFYSTINKNDEGYIEDVNEDIIFGVRDNNEFETLIQTTYAFNNKMNLSIRVRHYWAKAEYARFGVLQEDGRLGETAFDEFRDNSFNSLNVDAVYRWRFAPGSDIFIVWKNNTTQSDKTRNSIRYSYLKGVGQLREIPSLNSLSLRIVYFLDYLSLKKKQ